MYLFLKVIFLGVQFIFIIVLRNIFIFKSYYLSVQFIFIIDYFVGGQIYLSN